MNPPTTNTLLAEFFAEQDLNDDANFGSLKSSLADSLDSLEEELKQSSAELERVNLEDNLALRDDLLDSITCLFNNFSNHSDSLSRLYGEKLYLLQILTNNLLEFSSFESNVAFFNSIAAFIEDPDRVPPGLSQKLELAEAIEAISEDKPALQAHLTELTTSLTQTISSLLDEAIKENDLHALEELLQVKSALTRKLYAETVMRHSTLDSNLSALKATNFLSISESLFQQVENTVEDFFSEMIKVLKQQLAPTTGRIFLVLPPDSQSVAAAELTRMLKLKLTEFYALLARENNKSEEVFVRMVVKLIPSSHNFLKKTREIIDSELRNTLELQIVSQLRDLEFSYMFKEKQLVGKLVKLNFGDPKLLLEGIEDELTAGRPVNESALLEAIEDVNFGIIKKDAKNTLARTEKMLRKKEDFNEFAGDYFKAILGAVGAVLEGSVEVLNLALKVNGPSTLILKAVTAFSFKVEDFQKCFLKDLKESLVERGFFGTVSSHVKNQVSQWELSLSEVFGVIYSSVCMQIKKLERQLDTKKAYKGRKAEGGHLDSLVELLEPVLAEVESWDPQFKNKLYYMVSGAVADCLLNVLTGSKVDANGVVLLKGDIKFVATNLENCIPKEYFIGIKKVSSLSEILLLKDETEMEAIFDKLDAPELDEAFETLKRKAKKL